MALLTASTCTVFFAAATCSRIVDLTCYIGILFILISVTIVCAAIPLVLVTLCRYRVVTACVVGIDIWCTYVLHATFMGA